MNRALHPRLHVGPAIFAFTLLAAIASGGLSPALGQLKEDEPEHIKATGTVVWLDLEGGFWGIQGENHKKYDPLGSLPKEFRKTGLKVRFEAVVEKDQASIHQWGQIIKITKIEKVE